MPITRLDRARGRHPFWEWNGAPRVFSDSGRRIARPGQAADRGYARHGSGAMNRLRITSTVAALLCVLMLTSNDGVGSPPLESDGTVALVQQLLEELSLLRSEVALLRARIDALDAREEDAAPLPAAPAATKPAAVPVRIMCLEGMNTEVIELDVTDEVTRLLDEADALDERTRDAEEEATGLLAEPWVELVPPPWWEEDKQRRQRWEDALRRERSELRNQAVQYRVEARRKRGEATRLEQNASQTRQILWGWDGRQTVVLHAERDVAGALGGLAAGGFVTWSGRLTGMDAQSQAWAVTSVRRASRPSGFIDRPADGSPPGDGVRHR
jgi:hypothetical protein